MFWENFLSLCEEKNISPNAVCEALGFSNATATKWKHGAMPRNSTLQIIADYFEVPLERLFSSETKKSPSISDEDIKFALFGGEGEITDEMWQAVKEYAEFVKEKYGKK